MSVRSYLLKDGKQNWEVYVATRSKIDPSIRIQKRERGFESKAKAERRERELLDLVTREIVRLEGLAPTWGEVVSKWEKHLIELGQIQEVTIEDYVSMLRMWSRPIWKKIATEINRQDIRLLLQAMQNASKSNSFQSKFLTSIKRVYEWARDEGIIRGGVENLTLGIKVSKIEEKVPEILSMDEVKQLLSKAKEHNSKWYPIWSAAVLTGMRSGELYALKWSNIDFDNRVITVSTSFNKRKATIKSTKAGYFRTVPINESLFQILVDLKTTTTTDFVFPRIREWTMGLQAEELRKFCLAIGIKSVKFHALRACFATHLLSNGVSPAVVMKVAGWKGLDTMQRYTRLAGVYEKGATDSLNLI